MQEKRGGPVFPKFKLITLFSLQKIYINLCIRVSLAQAGTLDVLAILQAAHRRSSCTKNCINMTK